jgi:hypothetical protein
VSKWQYYPNRIQKILCIIFRVHTHFTFDLTFLYYEYNLMRIYALVWKRQKSRNNLFFNAWEWVWYNWERRQASRKKWLNDDSLFSSFFVCEHSSQKKPLSIDGVYFIQKKEEKRTLTEHFGLQWTCRDVNFYKRVVHWLFIAQMGNNYPSIYWLNVCGTNVIINII